MTVESKRAVLYARVSSDDRAQEGRNLESQLAMCRQYALAREWRIIAEFAEDERGASGAEFNLPKLNEVLDLAARWEFDVLVVRELDRLARSLPKQLLIESKLARTEVTIEYVLGVYPNTPEGIFIKNVRAAIAEFERLKILERTANGKIQAAKAGSVLVGHKPPYGYETYRINGQIKLRVREDEARIVRLVFAWYSQCDEYGRKLSMYEIAQRLTAMRVPTYKDARREHVGKAFVRHGHWNPTTIHNMLRKTEYIGQWHYLKSQMVEGKQVPRPREDRIPVEIPAIVDQATWLAVQTRRDLPRPKRQPRTSKFLLTSHIWCGVCNQRMYGRYKEFPSGTWRYYGCTKAGPQRCTAPYYVAEVVDKAVWTWVEPLLSEPDGLDNELRIQQLNWGERMAALRGQLAQMQEQIDLYETQQEALHGLYSEQELPKTMWAKRNAGLQQKLLALRQAQATLMARLEYGNIDESRQAQLHEFAGGLLAYLQATSNRQEAMRYIFNILNLQVILSRDPAGNRSAQMSCLFGPSTSSIPPVPLAKTVPLPMEQRNRNTKHDQ